MTKMPICDVCMCEGKLAYGKWRTGWKGDVKLDLCNVHRDHLKGKTKTDALAILIQADKGFIALTKKVE